MTTAERLGTSHLQPERSASSHTISMATLAVVAAALLIYVSSAFQLADLFGVKRLAQVLLITPIGAVAAYFFVSRPARLLDPLGLFALVKLGTEIALRGGRWSYVLDSFSTVLALTVVICVPARSFETAAKLVVTVSGTLALLALIQVAILAYDPQLNMYVLQPVDDGEIQDYIQHPIALMGLNLQRSSSTYSFWGITIARMQSFAKEPSLNVIYFMLPASLAFLLSSKASVWWGCVLLIYCVLSLSGSVFLACGFAGFCWLLSRVISMKAIVPYGMLVITAAYVVGLHFSALSILNVFSSISQYGDFLGKGRSLTSRTHSAVGNADAALAAPFGSATTADLPGPWLVTSALAAGWLGDLLLIWFLVKLGRQFEVFHAHSTPFGAQRFGGVLFMGALATALVFNDYQMSNYAGLLMMAFIYRTMHLRNVHLEQ